MRRPVLEMKLHERTVLQLVTGGGRFTAPERIETHPGIERVSASWHDRELDGRALELWLSALLPQGGARSLQRDLARDTFDAEGIRREPSDSADTIWGTPGYEYAGAVTFRSLRGQGLSAIEPPDVDEAALSPQELEREIVLAIVRMQRGRIEPGGGSGIQLPVSSGSLPKLGLRLEPRTGKWHRAGPGRLSTHIWKHEDRSHFPAEAAVETVCLRTLKNLGIRAARTRAVMAGDFQMIVSERSDRAVETSSGQVTRIHQEEWVQAAGYDPVKLSQEAGERGGWRELHTMLSNTAADPQAEREHLWKVLAACVMLGHRDLHRRNIGIRHVAVDRKTWLELAPLYDAGSMEGQAKGYSRAMPMPVGGVREIEAIDEDAWVNLARECGREPDEVLAGVRRMAQEIDDALANAMEAARREDEWGRREEAAKRLGLVQENTRRRAAKARPRSTGRQGGCGNCHRRSERAAERPE